MYRALSSPVRRRVLAILRADDQPRDVRGLADQVALSANTVRAHLHVLEDAGLVVSHPEERERPGRPRLVYRVTAKAAEAGEGQQYRFLAKVLASYLAATAGDPAGAAEQAGRVWGHYLVDRPGPFETVEPAAAVDRLVELFTQFGFAPELETQDPAAPQILLRHCPFLDIAKDNQQVVCSLHLGLMRGALDELGTEVEARDLIPFAEPSLCVSHLAVPD